LNSTKPLTRGGLQNARIYCGGQAREGRSCPSSRRDDHAGDAWVPDALESALTEIVALLRPHQRQNLHFVRVSDYSPLIVCEEDWKSSKFIFSLVDEPIAPTDRPANGVAH